MKKFDQNFEERWINKLGDSIAFRMVRASDKELFQTGLQLLSPVTIYSRFKTVKNRFTDSELKYLTEVDGAKHFAIVAIRESDGVLVGVGRGIADPVEAKKFECGLIVADCMHRTGIGRKLFHYLIEAAQEREYLSMTGEMFSENSAMFHLIDTSGLETSWLMLGSEVSFISDIWSKKN